MTHPTHLTRLALAAVVALAAAACGGDARDPSDGQPDAGTCTPSCGGATCGQGDGCGGKCVGTCGGGGVCNETTFTCEVENTCEVADALGTPTLAGQEAVADEAAPDEYVNLVAKLNGDAKPDMLSIELYAFMEGTLFEEGLRTGTFEISGDEAQYATCSICVFVWGNVDEAAQSSAADYFLTGGTVELTSVEGQLSGTITNATFTKVDISDEFVSTPHVSGCTAGLERVAFDTEISLESFE